MSELPAGRYDLSPRNIAPGDSAWKVCPVSQELWTEGFWPGVLWYAYEASGDMALLDAARNYTEPLEFLSGIPAYDHDLGFIMFCSYGNGYRLTGDERYRQIILNTAERISELYNPKVGTILSWPREIPTFGGHNTIMDNMINLETLFWAAENGDFLRGCTHQGYSDSSMWARGQAWAIYGYTMCYLDSAKAMLKSLDKKLSGFFHLKF